MQSSSKINSNEYTDLNKVIGWFISLRFIASICVFIALFLGFLIMNLSLPYTILFPLNGLLFFINVIFTIYFSKIKQSNLSRVEMSVFFHIQICFDYLILFFLVYFTGFLENPFIYYFIFHVMLSSLIFSPKVIVTYVSALISLFLAVILLEYYNIIPHFHLTIVNEASYNELIFIRFIAFATTLIFMSYMIIQIERRIEEKGEQVKIELDHYKSLDKIKSNFILQVTHELRGPIAALMGYHEMILKGLAGDINQKTEDIIRKANRRTGNLLTIIDEMLDYAYMKSEEDVSYKNTRVSLKPVIDYNIDLYLNQADEKDISFTTNCSKELMVLADRDLLNIIFGNLLNNAIKYSPGGTTITVNGLADNGKAHIIIKDEGMGIEPSELVKVFEEFYRTRRAREVEKDGTGLGLSIVQRAIEKMNGEITLYSEVDKGSTFHVYLPLFSAEIQMSEGKNEK